MTPTHDVVLVLEGWPEGRGEVVVSTDLSAGGPTIEIMGVDGVPMSFDQAHRLVRVLLELMETS